VDVSGLEAELAAGMTAARARARWAADCERLAACAVCDDVEGTKLLLAGVIEDGIRVPAWRRAAAS
jgi:hypothetical protein